MKSCDLHGVSCLKARWDSQGSYYFNRNFKCIAINKFYCRHLEFSVKTELDDAEMAFVSREMYDTLKEYQIPEIQRISLLELCLFFAPDGESITSFMKRMPDPSFDHGTQRPERYQGNPFFLNLTPYTH